MIDSIQTAEQAAEVHVGRKAWIVYIFTYYSRIDTIVCDHIFSGESVLPSHHASKRRGYNQTCWYFCRPLAGITVAQVPLPTAACSTRAEDSPYD